MPLLHRFICRTTNVADARAGTAGTDDARTTADAVRSTEASRRGRRRPGSRDGPDPLRLTVTHPRRRQPLVARAYDGGPTSTPVPPPDPARAPGRGTDSARSTAWHMLPASSTRGENIVRTIGRRLRQLAVVGTLVAGPELAASASNG